MKYLNHFENYNDKKYWAVPMDDYFFIRLVVKLGLSIDKAEEIFDRYLDLYDNQQLQVPENTFFFIAFYNGEYNNYTYLEYNDIPDKNDIISQTFSKQGYIKQPDIEITPEDIKEWELLMDTKKYNL